MKSKLQEQPDANIIYIKLVYSQAKVLSRFTYLHLTTKLGPIYMWFYKCFLTHINYIKAFAKNS